jgi:hypothetical protein
MIHLTIYSCNYHQFPYLLPSFAASMHISMLQHKARINIAESALKDIVHSLILIKSLYKLKPAQFPSLTFPILPSLKPLRLEFYLLNFIHLCSFLFFKMRIIRFSLSILFRSFRRTLCHSGKSRK